MPRGGRCQRCKNTTSRPGEGGGCGEARAVRRGRPVRHTHADAFKKTLFRPSEAPPLPRHRLCHFCKIQQRRFGEGGWRSDQSDEPEQSYAPFQVPPNEKHDFAFGKHPLATLKGLRTLRKQGDSLSVGSLVFACVLRVCVRGVRSLLCDCLVWLVYILCCMFGRSRHRLHKRHC